MTPDSILHKKLHRLGTTAREVRSKLFFFNVVQERVLADVLLVTGGDQYEILGLQAETVLAHMGFEANGHHYPMTIDLANLIHTVGRGPLFRVGESFNPMTLNEAQALLSRAYNGFPAPWEPLREAHRYLMGTDEAPRMMTVDDSHPSVIRAFKALGFSTFQAPMSPMDAEIQETVPAPSFPPPPVSPFKEITEMTPEAADEAMDRAAEQAVHNAGGDVPDSPSFVDFPVCPNCGGDLPLNSPNEPCHECSLLVDVPVEEPKTAVATAWTKKGLEDMAADANPDVDAPPLQDDFQGLMDVITTEDDHKDVTVPVSTPTALERWDALENEKQLRALLLMFGLSEPKTAKWDRDAGNPFKGLKGKSTQETAFQAFLDAHDESLGRSPVSRKFVRVACGKVQGVSADEMKVGGLRVLADEFIEHLLPL